MPTFDPGELAWFADAGRAVQRLYAARSCDVLLVCWGPGQKSSTHDHGASESVVIVLQGRLTAVEDGVERTCGPGTIVVTRSGSTHQLRNESAEPAMTIHLYAPPLAGPISPPFRDLSIGQPLDVGERVPQG